jgi:aromatic ring-opening dioxygenase catalytic subunit (LigB family)
MMMVAAAGAGMASAGNTTEKRTGGSTRQPVIFVPHGGGPWPFVDLGGFVTPHDVAIMRGYFEALPKQLPSKPKALLVISAHWEAALPTVMTAAQPSILYDYYGFPPESYDIQWPAPGEPALARRVQQLLAAAGIDTASDDRRGFDHGTFVPFKLSWPDADVPTIQLSLKAGLDPAEHLAIGRALAPLRDEGVLILGSGMSYHNMRGFNSPSALAVSREFDGWLQRAATASPEARDEQLRHWAAAPSARQAHPREEHLMPLMVVAGAAGSDQARVTFSEDWMRVRISAFHFG